MIVDVELSPDADGVLLHPAGDPLSALARLLGAVTPPIRGRRHTASIRVLWRDVARLGKLDELTLRWDDRAERAARNRESIRRHAPEVLRAAAGLRADPRLARKQVEPFLGRLELDEHQVQNVGLMTLPDAWGACIFDEQGTGKTVSVIAAFDVLVAQGVIERLLIAAPKSMVAEWRAEFERFCGDLYHIAVADGPRRQRSLAINSGADVVVCGYETVVSHRTELERTARRARTALVVDESFAVKNPDATRTSAMAEVRESCVRAFVLCGTPAPNVPRDIVAQFDLVDLGMTFEDLPPSGDLDDDRREIAIRMSRRGLFTRNRKDAVLPELPSRRFTEVTVDMAPEQARAYEEALQSLVRELHATTDRDFQRRIATWLERRAALLRICSNPGGLIEGWTETPAKLSALDELLERLVAEKEKVVIWSFYRASLEALAVRYAGLGLVRVDGSVSDTVDRREAVRSFQEDPQTHIFLGNPAAAGAGLTLHAARVAIYESLSNQAAHWMQSLDRIHRRGQERSVEYLTLLCRDTIEVIEYERLREKADRQAHLLGDPAPDRHTRIGMLEELLADRAGLLPSV